MSDPMAGRAVEVWATCPPSPQFVQAQFRCYVMQSARWAEEAGCHGLLVFTDHQMVDPWAVAQLMIGSTERIVPLVAAQPPYLHPFAVARMVATLGYMYGRRVDLNLVTGGNPRDLVAVGSKLEHDERYRRLVEYGQIIHALLTEPAPVTLRGKHYQIARAFVKPRPAPDLAPRLYVAGSSEACRRAAEELTAVRLAYPQPVDTYAGDASAVGQGIRIGIIARETSASAWQAAHRRFPPDQRGERAQDVASAISDSQWHRQLSHDARRVIEEHSPYWLYPFRTAKEYCPYLVGSYAETAALLARYLELGVRTIILQAPRDADELQHAQVVVRRAAALRATGVGAQLRPRGPDVVD